MILVTGGTGFIGQVLIRQLINSGQQVRTLIRPSVNSPKLPKGISVDVVVASMTDINGVRAAMRDVDVVFHLAGGESKGSAANLTESDVYSTQAVTQASKEAGVSRLVYVSHIGADRNSAFPVMKAKGLAESIIKASGVPFTILRTGLVFGPGDHFTETLKTVMKKYPILFALPDRGLSGVQPVWVDDLVTCLNWCMDQSSFENQSIEVSGSESFQFRQVVEIILARMNMRKWFVGFESSYLRWITLTLGSINPLFPLSTLWIDYLAESHTCPLDSMTRFFGILPARFSQKIDYLSSTTRK
jgi:NADH dehydrogenase